MALELGEFSTSSACPYSDWSRQAGGEDEKIQLGEPADLVSLASVPGEVEGFAESLRSPNLPSTPFSIPILHPGEGR